MNETMWTCPECGAAVAIRYQTRPERVYCLVEEHDGLPMMVEKVVATISAGEGAQS